MRRQTQRAAHNVRDQQKSMQSSFLDLGDQYLSALPSKLAKTISKEMEPDAAPHILDALPSSIALLPEPQRLQILSVVTDEINSNPNPSVAAQYCKAPLSALCRHLQDINLPQYDEHRPHEIIPVLTLSLKAIIAAAKRGPAPQDASWSAWLGTPATQPGDDQDTEHFSAVAPLDSSQLTEIIQAGRPPAGERSWPVTNLPGPPPKRATETSVLRRGWTKDLIKKLLGQPDDSRLNPKAKTWAPMKLYDRRRVELAEQDPEFTEHFTRMVESQIKKQEARDARKRELLKDTATANMWLYTALPNPELMEPFAESQDRLVHVLVHHAVKHPPPPEQKIRGLSNKEIDNVRNARAHFAIAAHWPSLAHTCHRRIQLSSPV